MSRYNTVYRNGEGYYDPTAGAVIRKILREERYPKKPQRPFRPLVFICSPYAGDITHNVENARRYCRFAVAKGYIPIAPHLLFPQFMNDRAWDVLRQGAHGQVRTGLGVRQRYHCRYVRRDRACGEQALRHQVF